MVEDLLSKSKEATNILDPSKIIQVSLEGPNVKLYKGPTADRWNELPATPSLSDEGC